MTTVLFSVLKFQEGGAAFADHKFALEDAGVTPVRRAPSVYVGHIGIEVPKKFQRKASRILFGR